MQTGRACFHRVHHPGEIDATVSADAADVVAAAEILARTAKHQHQDLRPAVYLGKEGRQPLQVFRRQPVGLLWAAQGDGGDGAIECELGETFVNSACHRPLDYPRGVCRISIALDSAHRGPGDMRSVAIRHRKDRHRALSWRPACPPPPMTLADLLQRQGRVAAERPAIFEGSRTWATHAEWAARSAGLAQRLLGAGLQSGDRVRDCPGQPTRTRGIARAKGRQ